MAAPEHVPLEPLQLVRTYGSPPWRPDPWFADRPAEIRGRQPVGERLGVPGPDAGYALLLASRFSGRLTLLDGEHEADALAGATAVATKRSGLFGRAPIVHDLTVGLTVWGFLDTSPPAPLVTIRRDLFEEVHLTTVHYPRLRAIADAVPESVLVRPHDAIAQRYEVNWRSCLDLPAELVTPL